MHRYMTYRYGFTQTVLTRALLGKGHRPRSLPSYARDPAPLNPGFAVRHPVVSRGQPLRTARFLMCILNKGIARQANAGEGIKDRFREGRFKSQALLDLKNPTARLRPFQQQRPPPPLPSGWYRPPDRALTAVRRGC